jgi:hypothetical protein
MSIGIFFTSPFSQPVLQFLKQSRLRRFPTERVLRDFACRGTIERGGSPEKVAEMRRRTPATPAITTSGLPASAPPSVSIAASS